MTAAQLSTAPVYIPTPEATRKADDYDKLYKSNFKMPKNFIRFSTVIEDCVSVPYDMDDLDDDWLKGYNEGQLKQQQQPNDSAVSISEDQFEILFSQLEKCAMEKVSNFVVVLCDNS